eukprot:jgi/Mesen1/6886/ME000353S05910
MKHPWGAAVRLPAFHTCIGAGKERQLPKWYKEHGIELLLNTRVVAADVHRKQLTTAAGETITYQTLIIATGARAEGDEDRGVGDVNCDWPHQGWLAQGRRVARLFTPEIAEFYEAFYRNKGVTFLKGTVMSTFETDESGKVSAVVLKDGARVECDMVVVGVGIRPNAVLFERQLAMEKDGIRVSGKMRTSSASVYAIGDVAAFPLRLYGDTRRLEHVDHARKSAAHAVQTIMAGTSPGDYDYLPYFYSRVFSLSWQFFGDNVGDCVLFGSFRRRKFGAYWVDKGRVVGAFLEGGSQDEYSAIARVARLRPPVADKARLPELGLGFAMQFAEQPQPGLSAGGGGQAGKGGAGGGGGGLLMAMVPSPLTVQLTAGICVAASVAAVAYLYGKRKKRF